ncbi:MAG: AAA family ATPase [Microthrixaceae bacterium]
MRSTAHGLVIGKFYPPHDGHELLFRAAASASDRLSILVLAHPEEHLDVRLRVEWITEMLDDLGNVTVAGGIDLHPVDYDDPLIWDLHEAAFRDLLVTVTTEPVTAVFSSESYGAELARRFGSRHVPIDVDRILVPISGTRIRSDPVENWDHLPESVRGGLCRRVVVLGAESTGTTTVSRVLTDLLRRRGGPHGMTRWVPEYGRQFTLDKLASATAASGVNCVEPPTMDDLDWQTQDFIEIAARQNQMEDQEARVGGPVLLCDTDAFATGLWHERYAGHRSNEVDALARHHDLYLLTNHRDVPFVQDGIRDGESIREWMTERFIEELVSTGRNHVVLTGPLDERLHSALEAVDELLQGDLMVRSKGLR